jgi:SET domain-containing protein
MAEVGRFKYVQECVGGPGVDITLDKCLYKSCDCPIACSEGCGCFDECPYTNHGVLCDSFAQLENCSPVIFECNRSCSCPVNCINRLTQREVPSDHVIIKEAEGKGMGLFANVDLIRGTFVGQYVGEIIKISTARERLRLLSANDPCYLLCFKEHMASGVTVTTAIDAGRYGNHTRFINHSCDPNLVLLAVRRHSIVPSLCLFTCRFVKAGDELCFSYCGNNRMASVGRRPCLCGTENCMKFLPLQCEL